MNIRKILLFTFILVLSALLSGCGTATQAAIVPRSTPIVVHTPVPTATRGVFPLSTPASGVAKPVRLLAPAVGIDAPIENVGIAANGDLATPMQNPWTGVGWYSNGPHPGETGSSVIDGHLDRPGGYPAVFWNLRNLQAGNEVLVVNTQGKTLRFRVTRVASYAPQEAPVQDIFGAANGTYLNLITCAGTWVPSQHQTTLRLVVYTTLE